MLMVGIGVSFMILLCTTVQMQKGEPMNEIYRLRLDHYIDDGEKRHQIEEPLVIQMIVDRTYMPVPVCLNNMLDKMREELLNRV